MRDDSGYPQLLKQFTKAEAFAMVFIGIHSIRGDAPKSGLTVNYMNTTTSEGFTVVDRETPIYAR